MPVLIGGNLNKPNTTQDHPHSRILFQVALTLDSPTLTLDLAIDLGQYMDITSLTALGAFNVQSVPLKVLIIINGNNTKGTICCHGSLVSGTCHKISTIHLMKSLMSSLRGATMLKARLECKNKLNGSTPILQIEENNDFEFDFENCRSILAKGSGLHVETLDGTFCEDFLYVGTLIEICYCNLSCIQKKNPFA
ncbi:hypothetical protein TEA_004999 [Camellia sinensis var. sinensis]|uniref:Uncharacterized protein n=1 Tax=Camellia sinensis var. sinensis TaxID=542762 RepID=A0A4S4F3A6_CAMSN|nr:hypothetical protein TEA_004999 [Camellia sinensis var. sinensis]